LPAPSAAHIEAHGASLSSTAHNEYLQLAVELGLVGLALYLAVLGGFFYCGVRLLPQMTGGSRKWLLLAALGAVAAQCVDALGNPGWHFGDVSSLLWLMLGMGTAAMHTPQEAPMESRIAVSRSQGSQPRRLGWRAMTVMMAASLIALSFSAGVGASSGTTDNEYCPGCIGTALASSELGVSLTLPMEDDEFDFNVNNDPNLQPCIASDDPNDDACTISALPNQFKSPSGGDGKPNGFGFVAAIGPPGAKLAFAHIPPSTSVFSDSTQALTYASKSFATAQKAIFHGFGCQIGKAVAESNGESQSIDLCNRSGVPITRTIQGRYRFELLTAVQCGSASAFAQFEIIDETDPNAPKILLGPITHSLKTGTGENGSLNSCDIDGHVSDPGHPGCAVPFDFDVSIPAHGCRKIRISVLLRPDATHPEPQPSDVAITKTAAADSVETGSDITYTIQVTNNRAEEVMGVRVADNLPSETTFVSCSATGGGVCGGSANNRTFFFPSLPGGATETITLVAKANCKVARQ
jgi:uncharacterized repeat protein (TIGR01451 family)